MARDDPTRPVARPVRPKYIAVAPMRMKANEIIVVKASHSSYGGKALINVARGFADNFNFKSWSQSEQSQRADGDTFCVAPQ